MFFEDSDSQEREGEVRISATEKDTAKEAEKDRSKLEKEAESKLLGNSSGSDKTGSSSGSGGGVTIEDVHEQNQRIIELLEELNEDGSTESSGSQSSEELGGAAADGLL